jgi:heptosyltransferase III
MNQPKNILIARTDRIGDVILTLPAAAVLKKHFPGCRVTFLLREYTKELTRSNPYIDETLVLKEAGGKPAFFANLKMVKEKKFDTVITVFPRFRIALFLFYAGINTRVGSGYRWYSFLFNKKIYEHRKYGEKHELVHNINLLKALDINETVTEKDCVFGLHPAEENKIIIENFIKEKGIDLSKPVIIFHPGSGGSAVDLPMDKMKELVKKTTEELDSTVFLTGDKKEAAVCDSFPKGENIFNLCGMFNLGELIALIDRSSLLAANSTGPLHIAAALGKNVIGFYPKIKAQSPVRWAPFTEKKQIFVPSVNCTGCTRKQYKELNCMNSISVDDAFEAIKKSIITAARSNK